VPESVTAADGDVVLAVHGFASSAEGNWITSGWERPLTDAGYRLVAFDLRGHGASGRPEDPASYRLTILADDALRVLDAVGADRAHWLGYSLGSRIGLEVARVAPRRLRSLSLGGVASADPPAERLVSLADALGLDDPALRAFATGVSADAPPFPDVPLGIPTLVAVGSADDIAAGAAQLAARLDATFVEIPGRTHANAITARAFKDAVLETLSAS